MDIAVTGCSGQLGSVLSDYLSKFFKVISLSRNEMDITNSGTVDRVELAKAILELIDGSAEIKVVENLSSVNAPRPKNSVLKNVVYELYGYQPLRNWRDALEEYIDTKHIRMTNLTIS